jgi:enterochelin esterase-like enzyme/lysophospholipase L1-like esterase
MTLKSLSAAAVGVGVALFAAVIPLAQQAPAPAAPAPQTAAPPAPGAPAQPPAPDMNRYYQIGPDSLAKDGVPKGEVRGPFVIPSQAYPGTQHTYWVHVPAQYDAAVAADLMVFQDGQAFKDMEGVIRAPNVLDNLIYRRELPVMITVFINPGRTPEQPEPTPAQWGDQTTNRPTEYNTLDDKYARVVCDELMPELYKNYNISKDPDRHGIGGASSGAIAAFTVAWQRPDQFHKVLSIVGSFTNIRGGDAYTDIVRSSERKPIRIFLVDGRNDNRGQGRGGTYDPRRDWFLNNVRLTQALTEKGYDVNYAWGMNTHGQRMGGPMLPEMMRWLWRDHPASTEVTDMVERSFNEAKVKTGPARFESAVAAYEAADRQKMPAPGAILLTGDSQFYRWKTLSEDLAGYTAVNRGIDSFQLSDLLVYADRLVAPYKPRMIVLHAGGNDIHNGRTPQQVTDDFKAFVARVRQTMPAVPIAFTSITPSPGRWSEADVRMAANKRIQSYIATQPNLLYIDLWDAFLQPDGRPRADLYVEDQIHPNHDGYLVRVKIMKPILGAPEKR